MKASALILLGLLASACGAGSPSAVPTEAATPTATPTAEVSEEPSQSSGATPSRSPTAAVWQLLPNAGPVPKAREDHTWTLAPDGSTAYLFGGRTTAGEALGDFWAFDLASVSWRRLPAAGPPARFGHSAVWVEGTGLVIFAGQAGATFFNDLWAFDPEGDAWRELPGNGARPVPRYGSCAALGPDGRLWISHGFTNEGTRFADTLAYDFATSSWTDETPSAERPIARCLHGCWWTDEGAFVLYAGQTTGVTALDDLWHLAPGVRPGTNAWSRLEPSGGLPPPRNLYAAGRWRDGELVWGGQTLDESLLGDAWWLSDEAGDARLVEVGGEAPPGRAAAELLVLADGRVLLFGGRGADGALNDLWELTLPDIGDG